MNCSKAQLLLSEYIDNALSAHLTWELDKHLADCSGCARALNEMRRTVAAIAEAPRFEVSDDFMAKLHSRIAAVEPAPTRRAWLASVQDLFRPRALPAWGAALATCALVLVMVVPRPAGNGASSVPSPAPAEPAIVQAARSQNVELTASTPLGDPAAAALVAANQGGEPE